MEQNECRECFKPVGEGDGERDAILQAAAYQAHTIAAEANSRRHSCTCEELRSPRAVNRKDRR